jgi:alpha-tubulin suppressor-like RCC1 family protein
MYVMECVTEAWSLFLCSRSWDAGRMRVFVEARYRGDNGSGRRGNGSNAASSSPAAVSGLASGGTSIAAGGAFTCALRYAGTVFCRGSNSDGQPGDGTTTDRLTPVEVSCR